MQRVLDGRQRRYFDLAARLADDFQQRAENYDRDGEFPFENFEKMQDAGYLRLCVPEEFGGLGATLPDLVIAQERLAMGCPATAVAVNMHMAPVGQAANAWKADPNPRAEGWLRDIAAGKVLMATVYAEPGASLLRNSSTVATRTNGGYRVQGRKIFGTGSSVMTHLSTMARYDDPSDGPVVMFFRLPSATKGVEVVQTWDVLGMRATQSNDILLNDVFVPDDAVYHRFPVGTLDARMLRTLWGWAEPTFGACYLGTAAGAFEWARKHVAQTDRRNDPIVQQLFAEMEILLETARALLLSIANEVVSTDIAEDLGVQAGMARVVSAKYVAVNNAVAIVDKAMVAVGGAAYSNKCPLSRLYRDVRAGTIHPYNNIDALRLIGQSALGVATAPVNPVVQSRGSRSNNSQHRVSSG